MENKTKKEVIYDLLKDQDSKEIIDTVALSKKSGSSMAYINSMLKHALELEFLGFHDSGNYMIKNLPKWTIFKSELTRIAEEY